MMYVPSIRKQQKEKSHQKESQKKKKKLIGLIFSSGSQH